MFSIENYKKIKGELSQLLVEGGDLDNEDDFFIGLITNSKNPSVVVDVVRGFKEGNVLYKQKKFEAAIERYGYSGVIIARYEVTDEAIMNVLYDLATCIILNLAACFSKKVDFDEVGRLCTILLEINPENVKALFRRAVAAIELGRSDVAYWDLMLVNMFDPDNQEVSRKLQQVKKSLAYSNEKKHQHDEDIPLGLGVGLCSPSKKVKNGSACVQVVSQRNSAEEESLNELRESDKFNNGHDKYDEMKGNDVEMDDAPKDDGNVSEKIDVVSKNFNAQDNTKEMEVVDEMKIEEMKEVGNDTYA